MISNIEKFKRANFFTGLMATPQFWNDIQDYNFNKERFYNLIFNGYGIVPGVKDELKVASVNKKGGGLSLVINPGFAIDKMGRGLFLYEPIVKIIDYKKYKLPMTVYLTIQYNEELDEFYQNEENSEYQGYQKKLEAAIVEVTTKEPDDTCLELARIRLEEDTHGEIKSLEEPGDVANPKSNEIDIRFVTWVRPVKQGLSPYFKKYFVDILEETRNIAISAYDSVNLTGLRELQTLALTAKMLVQCGDLAFEDSINILYPLFDVNNHIIQEMLEYERSEEKRIFSTKDIFNTYRSRIYEMGDLIKYFDHKFETLDKILKCHMSLVDCLKNIFVTRKISLEDIAYFSYDLPRILVIGHERYTLVEYLDFNDMNTESNHNLKTEDVRDYTANRQSFSYPDGEEVMDTIKRYVGGKVTFTIRNIIKKRKLLLVRRSDIFHGNYKVDIALDGNVEKQLIIDGYDTKHRWRNLSALFEEEQINSNSIECSFIMDEKGRDNFAKIWVYQKL